MKVFVLYTEIRFYEQDGWTSNLLSLYITKGSMISFGCDSTDTKKYWTLKNGSSIDTDRMLVDKVISEVVRSKDVEALLTDPEVLRARSWFA